MTWSADAVGPLAEAFDGLFGTTGVLVAAACVDDTGTSIRACPGDAPADGRFEIGSITKTMTATLLAMLEADGTLRLDDPVSRWLSAGDNGGITLRQFATHTSGLPRLAPNHDLSAVDPANPYAGFTFELAEEGLRQTTVAPGAVRAYSNFGYHLLGLVLERASGLAYRDLIAGRLLEPLAMTCSGVGSNGGGIPLSGHDSSGEVPRWDDQPLGAAGVDATISDLARYAKACLDPPPGPSARRSPRRWRPRTSHRETTVSGRPWRGSCLPTAPAPITAGPADLPRPFSLTLVSAGRSRSLRVAARSTRRHSTGRGGSPWTAMTRGRSGRSRRDRNGTNAPARSSS
jgi:CubicO group peptidase (beta-lactamase class C family)